MVPGREAVSVTASAMAKATAKAVEAGRAAATAAVKVREPAPLTRTASGRPSMAVKRGLTGTVYVTVTLDAGGNCIGVSASGDGLLAKAATKAVYAACPYPNPTGSEITINVPVTFELQ